mgnify:CR=1 FL=1
MLTLVDLVNRSAGRFGSRTALVLGEQTVTYRELGERSSCIAACLRADGMGKGSRIAILSENCPEWGVTFFGILKAGATAVCMDPFLTIEEIRFILEHSDCSGVFASAAFTGTLHETADSLPRLRRVCDIGEIPGDEQQSPTQPPTASEYDQAVLIYTSGTTGSQKGVMLSHRNILSNACAAAARVPYGVGTTFLSLLPLSHMFGITVGLIGPLLNGGTIAYAPSLKGYEIVKAMREHRPDVMVVVPLMLRLFGKMIQDRMQQAGAATRGLFHCLLRASALCTSFGMPFPLLFFRRIHAAFGGNLKYFICGGAPLDRETEDFFERLRLFVLAGYGLTETSPVVSVCSLKMRKPGTVGKPLEGVEVRLSPEGEIAIGGPGVMMGYYKNPEATAGVLRGGRFHTGDIGQIDEDGFLSIRGRMKNVIVTASGLKVFPEEIEEKLATSPLIGEVCVVGRQTARGEQPYAVVVPERAGSVQAPEAAVFDLIRKEIDDCQKDVSPQKRVTAFELWSSELPKTTTKKVKRNEVRRMVSEKRERTPRGTTGVELDAFGVKVRSVTARVAQLDESAIAPSSRLAGDLGIDSLMRVEVLALLDKELGVCIPDQEAYRIDRFDELVATARTFFENPVATGREFDLKDLRGDISGLINQGPLYRGTRLFVFVLVKLAARLYFRLTVSGADRIPSSGSCIVASNHTSLMDFPLIYASLPPGSLTNTVAPAAKDFFFEKPLLGFLVQCAFNAFPLERYGNFFEGLKICARLLNAGKSMVLFPEGGRSAGDRMQPFKPGIGMLSLELRVPVVPAYIRGADKVLPKGGRFPKPRKVSIVFGEPISPEGYASLKGSRQNHEIYKLMIDEARARIEALREAA